MVPLGVGTPTPIHNEDDGRQSGQRVYWTVERYWHRMLCSRSRKGHITWDVFQRIKARTPIMRPKLFLPYTKLQSIAVL